MINSNFYPTKDSFVWNGRPKNNFGSDAILELSITGATSTSSTGSWTRSIIQFDSSITAGLTGSYSATLTMFDARSQAFVDENFSLHLFPITERWNEGNGSVNYPVTAAVSYQNRDSVNSWSSSGVSYSSSPSAAIFFASGTENLTASVTGFIEYWKTSPNYGLLIKYPDSSESSTSGYKSIKYFFSRSADTILKPVIAVAQASSMIKDDLANIKLGSNTFFVYDRNVATSAYPGYAFLKYDLSSPDQTLQTLTNYDTGVWFATASLTSLNFDGIFWCFSNTAVGYSVTATPTGSHNITTFFNNNINYTKASVISLPEYLWNETPVIRARCYTNVQFRMGTRAERYFPENLEMQFLEKNTRTPASPWNPMNYDGDGHFIKVPMTNFVPNFSYFPILRISDYGEFVIREVPEAEFFVRKDG